MWWAARWCGHIGFVGSEAMGQRSLFVVRTSQKADDRERVEQKGLKQTQAAAKPHKPLPLTHLNQSDCSRASLSVGTLPLRNMGFLALPTHRQTRNSSPPGVSSKLVLTFELLSTMRSTALQILWRFVTE